MRRRRILQGLALVSGLALAGIYLCHGGSEAAHAANVEAPKAVAVVDVQRHDLTQTASFAAEMRPWQQIDIHAKVSGYLKAIAVDIGDQVRKDETIATLDVPEEEQDQAKAAADYNMARLDYGRIEAVIQKQPGLLAQEEVDKARGAYEEAKAAYERTKILAHYATITAPFDGVITRRFADPGALVQAGTSSDTQSLPLVHLAEIDKLRLDFPAPESLVAQMKTGMPVDVEIQATHEIIHSTIARMSDRVDPETRTMDVEIDLDNARQHLKPGMYATATVALASKPGVLAVPIQAVVRGGKPNVWLVNAQHVIEERPVTLGLETPDRVEITQGVAEGDMIIYGNRDSISTGMKVEPRLVSVNEGG
jgi:RND family efflux transporter MFP subunit